MEQKYKRSTWNNVVMTDPLVDNLTNDYFSSMSVLSGVDTVVVYVEGWEDVAFWTNIFNDFAAPGRKFNIMPPVRDDLAKGKKVVLSFAPKSGHNLIMAIDSDFDWIFDGKTRDSFAVKQCRWLVQTYAYAIENLQCDPSSLSSVLVKASKCNMLDFDFESFFADYSEAVYPLFVRYSWSSFIGQSGLFPLKRFASVAKLIKFDVADKGRSEIVRISRSVSRFCNSFDSENHVNPQGLAKFEEFLSVRGVTRRNVHYFMQGHTLKDCVAIPLLESLQEVAICRQTAAISASSASAPVKYNQLSYYKNSLSPISFYLSDNTGYKNSVFYGMIKAKINTLLSAK